MIWAGLDDPRFIRPIRWIVAVLDGKPLKLTCAGIAAGDVTRGHRFLGAQSIRVRNFAEYEKKLRANGVIVHPAERREKIEKELAAQTKVAGPPLHAEPHLLGPVTYFEESSNPIQGEVGPAFLGLSAGKPLNLICRQPE